MAGARRTGQPNRLLGRSIRRTVGQFAVTGLFAVAALGFVAVHLLRSSGTSDAIADAKRLSRLAGDGVAAPRVTPAALRGDRDAVRELDEALRLTVLRGLFVRIKIWDASGRIVYSDEPRLIGARYRFEPDDLAALRKGTVDAELSDLSKPENRFERRYGKLLEVYAGIQAPGGQRLLFESYQPFSSIAASGRRTWLRFLPAVVGVLLLLELVQIPLAYLLARRLRDREQERRVLLHRALDASEAERRRIARDLHDGPVQTLAGVAFSLGAATERLHGADAGTRSTIRDAAGATRQTMRELRSTLVELYPASLRRSGLRAPLLELVNGLAAEGLEVHYSAPPGLRLPDGIETLLFRITRESLQNVRKHAQATRVDLELTVSAGTATLTIADDGRGFDPDALQDDTGLGLRLLEDAVAEAGGRMRISATPGHGTRVHVEVPS
jgi:signal transduction histidine kinase